MTQNHPEKVEHRYHDYAFEAETVADRRATENSTAKRGEQNFPVKLLYVIEELEKDGLDHVISWQPHGRCFIVHKQKEFVENVLPL
jgi:HSF-type DNA-binding